VSYENFKIVIKHVKTLIYYTALCAFGSALAVVVLQEILGVYYT
jgi:hypothetical protein